MSDQRRAAPDRPASPTTREHAASYQKGDQRKRSIDRLLIGLLALGAGCVKIPPTTSPAPVAVEVWVDAYAPADGDGGVLSALKTLPSTVSGVTHVRSGLYRGPFALEDGTVLIGHGEVVLFLEGEGPVATSRGRVRLEHVSFQGGSVGLSIAEGDARLAKVRCSGHRSAALTVSDAGLTAVELEVQSRRSEAMGVSATNAFVRLERATFLGPMAHGVSVTASQLVIEDLRSEGPANALLVVRGAVDARTVKAAGGMGPAVHLADTRAKLRHVETTGHEYGVLGYSGTIELDDFLSRAPVVAGAAFFKGTVTLTHARIFRAGSGGGLQLLDATSTLRDVTITEAQGTGVLLRQGHATIEGLSVSSVRGESTPSGALLSGDALQVRDSTLVLDRLDASEVDGAALSATNFSNVTATTIVVDGAGTAGVVAERKSKIVLKSLDARVVHGAALAVFEQATIELSRLQTTDVETQAWADCLGGAQLSIGAANVKQDWQPCVRAPR